MYKGLVYIMSAGKALCLSLNCQVAVRFIKRIFAPKLSSWTEGHSNLAYLLRGDVEKGP